MPEFRMQRARMGNSENVFPAASADPAGRFYFSADAGGTPAPLTTP